MSRRGIALGNARSRTSMQVAFTRRHMTFDPFIDGQRESMNSCSIRKRKGGREESCKLWFGAAQVPLRSYSGASMPLNSLLLTKLRLRQINNLVFIKLTKASTSS